MSLGETLDETGRLEEAVRVFGDAIEGARALGDRRIELRAAMRRLRIRLHSTTELNHEDAIREAEPARAFFADLGDDAGLAETLKMFGMVHLWAGRCDEASAVFGQVAEHASRAADRRLELGALHWMCLAIEEGSTPADEGIARIEALVERVGEDRIFWLGTRRFLGMLEAMRSRFADARKLVREGKETARELGMELELASGQLRNSAYVEYLAGDLSAAETDLREAVEILERIRDVGHLASVAPDLALVLLAAGGRDREALELIELGDANMIEDDVDAQVRARAARSRVLCRLGELADGERLARDAVARAWATDYAALRALSLEALAEVLHAAGRSDEATEALEQAVAVHEAKGNVVSAEAGKRLLAERRAARAL